MNDKETLERLASWIVDGDAVDADFTCEAIRQAAALRQAIAHERTAAAMERIASQMERDAKSMYDFRMAG